MINSEIKFTVRSFDLTLNKQEYELLKANVAGLQSKIQIRGESEKTLVVLNFLFLFFHLYIYIFFMDTLRINLFFFT